MTIAEVALIAALALVGLVTFTTVRYLQGLVRSYRVENQKLVAALISDKKPIQAAVYMSHDPETSTEEIIQDRAERKHLPMGLNGL